MFSGPGVVLPEQGPLKMYKIKIICAWCKRVLGEKESDEPGDTHTICASCLAKQNEEIAKLKDGKRA